MAAKIAVGAQWGDEGKGKIIDLLSRNADLVVRCQGGANAGHTVKIKDNKFVLHIIPSGVLHENCISVIANGVVFDYNSFIHELEMLKENGVNPLGRLFVNPFANVVMPYHPEYDRAREERRKNKIGTTCRGIGPAYQDKITRSGIRLIDFEDEDFFKNKLQNLVETKNDEFEKLFEEKNKFSYDEIYKDVMEKYAIIKPFIKDTSVMVFEAIKENKTVLFEGAQGTLLDIDLGTFPFVTSSNTLTGGICTGAGVGPTMIDESVGVIKAYVTRVGNGPFVTEDFGDEGKKLAEIGAEFGATTGRPRRCGHFDMLIAKYAARINGLTGWAITKLDVLDSFDKIKVCTAYEYKGEKLTEFNPVPHIMEKCTPLYEELDGWNEDISGCKTYDELPENCKKYIAYIEKHTGVPVEIVSVGPDREQSIFRK